MKLVNIRYNYELTYNKIIEVKVQIILLKFTFQNLIKRLKQKIFTKKYDTYINF